jgi:hypothetical protein
VIVRLHNPSRANGVVARSRQYQFDAQGYVTCGHLEDIRMLIQQGCDFVEVLEDDDYMNSNQFYLIDFRTIVSRGDADEHLERELTKVINENWKVFMSHNSKVLLYK